jgi:hypothetical protein
MTVVVEVPADECDACPANAHVKAFLYAELPNGGTLAYCAHHGTTHYDALTKHGARIIDLRYMVQP